jgi:hypothetical protein
MAGTRGTHVWMAASRIAAAHPRPHSVSCKLRSWEPDETGDLLECLTVWLNYTMLPSEVTTFRTLPFAGQGGTLEDASVAQAVNDMLLTSHGYGLRLFPIWAALRPRQSASFTTLRAKGAFLVSAQYDGAAERVTSVQVRNALFFQFHFGASKPEPHRTAQDCTGKLRRRERFS